MTPDEESQHWFFACPSCGASKSYAEAGGIRYRARRRLKIVRGFCERCDTKRFLRLEWRPPISNRDNQE